MSLKTGRNSTTAMPPSRLTPDVFVGLIRQSKLVDEGILKNALREMLSLPGVTKDPGKIAEELVTRKLLTRWQADKLLQGRHKGFFLGKYKLLSHLGRGGAGTVYLAEHSLMERRVAIKVLPRASADEGTQLARFRREAQALATLDHPNIVRANDIDQDGQVHFLVMEYVAGRSLQELVDADGPVSPVAAAEYTRQAAEGLHQAHKAGMVHRDIKPANLLLSERGVVKVLDLGLARMYEPGDHNAVTRQEQQLGTVDYMSPEQIKDPRQVDARGDLYSLGCTFYFLLVGQPPFNEGNDVNRLLAHQHNDPVPPTQLRPEIPADLERICLRLMSKRPEDRFESARELTRALVGWLQQSGGAEWAALNPVLGGASLPGMRPATANAPGPAPAGGKTVGSGPASKGPPPQPATTAGRAGSATTPKPTSASAAPSPVAAKTTSPLVESGQTKATAQTRPDPSESTVERPLTGTGVYAPVEDIHVSVDLSQMSPIAGNEDSHLRSFLNHLESPGAFPVGEAFADPNLVEEEHSAGNGSHPTVIIPDGWSPGQQRDNSQRELSDRGFNHGAEAELFDVSAPQPRETTPSAQSRDTAPMQAGETSQAAPAMRDVTTAGNPGMHTGTWQPPADDRSFTDRLESRRMSKRDDAPVWRRHPALWLAAALGLGLLVLLGWWLSKSPAK